MSIGKLPEKPNIVILLNDQDSAAPDWLPEFEEKHLEATKRLKKHGLSFKNNIIATCACTPARAALLTGLFPMENNVSQTIGAPKDKTAGTKPVGYTLNVLNPSQLNFGHMLKAAGYHVVWKGKWHLSHPVSGMAKWTADDIKYMEEKYGFSEWNPSDSGDSKSDPRTLGGGKIYHNDSRYVDGSEPSEPGLPAPPSESVVDFIKNYDKDKPFCLIVSLVNPHDIWVAPNYDDDDSDLSTGYSWDDGQVYDVTVPENSLEDLSFKPEVHTVWREHVKAGDNPDKDILDPKVQQNYVGFYAFLKKEVDKEMAKVLDALDEKGLTEDTLIIRTTDHGELGLAHGLREKPYNAYEEAINVPLIYSNPKLFPEGQETTTVASALDLMPTLARIAGVYDYYSYAFRGRDLTPVLTNPEAKVNREFVHFCYDDGRLPEEFKDTPQLIRTIRSEDWKYSVYFTSDGRKFEYEMYNLVDDPSENDNLAGQKGQIKTQMKLHNALESEIMLHGTLPKNLWWISDQMEERDPPYIPAYHWPTAEEAWEQSQLQYQINKVEQRLSSQKKTSRATRIASVMRNLSPDELWWVRPKKMAFNDD